MNGPDPRLMSVWGQKTVPVIVRRGKGKPLRLRMPFDSNNRHWLRNGRRNNPDWRLDKKCWELPQAWFNDLVERLLHRYGSIYVIQPYRQQEKCAPACLNARGHECQCSCMGANHGVGNDGSWFEVSETFATRWGEAELACRRMTLSRQAASAT